MGRHENDADCDVRMLRTIHSDWVSGGAVNLSQVTFSICEHIMCRMIDMRKRRGEAVTGGNGGDGVRHTQ